MRMLSNNEIITSSLPNTFRVRQKRLSLIEQAILKTVAYADVFEYPLKLNEIHRYLIEYPAEIDQVREALESGRLTPDYLERRGDYYLLRGREQVLAARFHRAGLARKLWPEAKQYGRMISRLPFVRMVAVTGSLVMNNVANRPDIDYLVAAEPGRVWLCRAGIIALVRFAALRNVILCPNYILSTGSLAITQQNIYTAHELTQMIPLSGMDVYDRLRKTNPWTEEYLPNAKGRPGSTVPPTSRPQSWLSRLSERLLDSRTGDTLEIWEMQRKIAKLQRQQPHQAESDFCPEWCKGHFENHGQKAMLAYDNRLKRLAEAGELGG